MTNAPYIAKSLTRRRLLRGAGAVLALPSLECLQPVFGRVTPPAATQRMVLISNNLGVLPKPFFPQSAGRGYALSPYLKELAEFREDFSIFSGLSHPDVTGGHSTENCFLTAARGPTKSGFRNQISLDQFAAEMLGQVTRFPTLNLGVNIDKANRSLSWTRDGVMLPAEDRASALFQKMFVQGDAAAVAKQIHRLEQRGSILDTLMEDAKSFSRGLGSDDRTRMDQYFTSVREVEDRLLTAREWELKRKPQTSLPEPKDLTDKKLFFQKFELMLAMAQLAIESDSTRIVTLMVDAFATPAFQLHPDQSTTDGYHNLSHHGQAVEKVRQLQDADLQQMALVKKLLRGLADKPEGGGRLLDHTMVLYGSNMGDANTHDNSNLPILLAGGGFNHGQHHVSKRDDNTPLCNLFVAMLQKLGCETDTFGSSSGIVGGI